MIKKMIDLFLVFEKYKKLSDLRKSAPNVFAAVHRMGFYDDLFKNLEKETN